MVVRPANPERPMKSLFTRFFHRKTNTIRKPRPGRRLRLESMEDRITPANVWVSTNSTSSQEVVREYTPSGSLLQTVVIPVSGPSDEEARDLSVAADGTIHVYNGTFDPILSTYAASSWSSRTDAGWSTANNVSYGGIARSGDYVFVTDMSTGSGDDVLKGIVRFNLADGTATRLVSSIDPIDVAIGQNGRLYALDAYQGMYVIHPETGALEQAFNLPYSIGGSYQDYRAITANAAGELFVATWGGQLHRLSATGVLQSSLTLPTASISNLTDIDLAADGTLAVGSRFGVVALTTEGFAAPTYITVGSTSSSTFVSFREDAPPPPAPLPGFSVSDATVTEGNSGTTTASFTVSLSQPLAEAVSVYYSTSSGTATSGSDFTSSANWLNFAAGETTKTVNITVNGDATYEPDEQFYVNLSYATVGTSLIDGQGVGTITNDDPVPPSLSVSDVTVTEGNSGTTTATFTVTLSFASTQSVNVNYNTSSGTASSASDYTSKSGSLTFLPGETSKTVSVNVTGDTSYEPNETFYLNLSSPVNALMGDSQGVATIANDDAAPPTLAVNDVTVTEGNSGASQATFTVTLSTASASTVTVSYYTSSGTASSSSDYTYTSGSLSFAPGETSKTVSVNVLGDAVYEPNEIFYLNLSTPSGATIADSQGIATITNDDVAPTLAVNDVTVTEGNSGFTYFNFTVTLSSASSSTVTRQLRDRQRHRDLGQRLLAAERFAHFLCRPDLEDRAGSDIRGHGDRAERDRST